MGFWRDLAGTAAVIGASAIGGPAAGAAAGAGMGMLGNMDKKKQQERTANLRAAEIEASPWTGRGPSTQISYASPEAADVLGGSLAGFSMGQQFQKAAPPAASPDMSVAENLNGGADPNSLLIPGAKSAQGFFAGGNPYSGDSMPSWTALAQKQRKPTLFGN